MAQAHYYYAMMSNNPDGEFKLDDIESMRNFLIKNPEIKELFHSNLSGIKIEYNTKTGEVGLTSKEENQNIKTSYSREAFKQISEVENAICRLAKHQLLVELAKLDDPEIMTIIKEYQLQFDGQAKNSSATADSALLKIMDVVSPQKENLLSRGMRFFSANESKNKVNKSSTQYAIHLAFEKYRIYEQGIDQIKSIGLVAEIMQTVKVNLPENKKSKRSSGS